MCLFIRNTVSFSASGWPCLITSVWGSNMLQTSNCANYHNLPVSASTGLEVLIWLKDGTCVYSDWFVRKCYQGDTWKVGWMWDISPHFLYLFFFFFFFFAFPSYISGVHHFWVRFLHMWPFFNPTVKVVTFRLCGWCLLGVFFVAGMHPSRTWTSGSFESVQWNACMHRLDLSLYSHPKEFWGEWSLNPC